jgi:hypothetical protein
VRGIDIVRLRTSSGADAFSEIFQDLNCFAKLCRQVYFSKPVNLPIIFSQVSLIFVVLTKLIRRQIKVTRSKVSDRTEANSAAVNQICMCNKPRFPHARLLFQTARCEWCYHVYSLGEELISLSYHPNQPWEPELLHLSWAVTTQKVDRNVFCPARFLYHGNDSPDEILSICLAQENREMHP